MSTEQRAVVDPLYFCAFGTALYTLVVSRSNFWSGSAPGEFHLKAHSQSLPERVFYNATEVFPLRTGLGKSETHVLLQRGTRLNHVSLYSCQNVRIYRKEAKEAYFYELLAVLPLLISPAQHRGVQSIVKEAYLNAHYLCSLLYPSTLCCSATSCFTN